MSTPSSTSKLVQRKTFWRVQSFEVGHDGRLHVSASSLFKHESWSLPLAILDSCPTKIKRFNSKSLFVSVLYAVISLFFWVGASAPSQKVFQFGDFALGGIFGALALLFVFRTYLSSVNAVVFEAKNGMRLPLWINNPTRESFEAFVRKLEESIKSAHIDQPHEPSFAFEIQKLKELFDRGLLDRDQFEAAKNKLTGNESHRKMGF